MYNVQRGNNLIYILEYSKRTKRKINKLKKRVKEKQKETEGRLREKTSSLLNFFILVYFSKLCLKINKNWNKIYSNSRTFKQINKTII